MASTFAEMRARIPPPPPKSMIIDGNPYSHIPQVAVELCDCHTPSSEDPRYPKRPRGTPAFRQSKTPAVKELITDASLFPGTHGTRSLELAPEHQALLGRDPYGDGDPQDLTIDPYLNSEEAPVLALLSTSPATPVEPTDLENYWFHQDFPQTPYRQPEELMYHQNRDQVVPHPRCGWDEKSLSKTDLAQLLIRHDGLYKCIVYFGLRAKHISDPELADKVKILEHCYLESQYLVEEIGKDLMPLYQTSTAPKEKSEFWHGTVYWPSPPGTGAQWTIEALNNTNDMIMTNSSSEIIG